MIAKIVKNISNKPTEKKYQRLMLKGKTVSEKILGVPGGADVLVAIGFTLTSDRLGIILRYEQINDIEQATFLSIIEAVTDFINQLQNELRDERLSAVITRENQEYGTKQNI